MCVFLSYKNERKQSESLAMRRKSVYNFQSGLFSYCLLISASAYCSCFLLFYVAKLAQRAERKLSESLSENERKNLI